MWSLRARTAVFVPRVAEGSRIAHSQKLLETVTRIRIRAAISRLALPGRGGEQGARVIGSLTLHGPYAGVRFRKGGIGEPDLGSSPVEMGSALLPLSPIIPIPATSVRVRSTDSPYLWAQFVNACLDPLSSSFCLGRCDREAMRLEPTFEVPARLNAWLGARKVSRRSGPVLELSGELYVPDGIFLHLRVSAGCDRFGEPRTSGGDGDPILSPERAWTSLSASSRPASQAIPGSRSPSRRGGRPGRERDSSRTLRPTGLTEARVRDDVDRVFRTGWGLGQRRRGPETAPRGVPLPRQPDSRTHGPGNRRRPRSDRRHGRGSTEQRTPTRKENSPLPGPLVRRAR
jgi:hypothetical protein